MQQLGDRLVRQLDKFGVAEAEKYRFSKFNDDRSIVLLGDPGAGKTHLFTYFSKLCGGRFLKARDFLIVDPSTLRGVNYLFIDALDEGRSGRGTDSTIDQIASRLMQTAPRHVRISCRAADWLGDYDLSALRLALSAEDEIKVLALERLSTDEQREILTGFGGKDPGTFLSAAVDRGLEFMLENPQTLTMLWQQVDTRGWPETRRDLFANSVELLLSEHSKVHKRQSSIAFTFEDRMSAAGAACALRLISDIQGIGLQEVSADDSCPSYCELSLVQREHLLGALSSRLFVADEAVESVDYLHRTLAEFAAASWLASRVREGLPFRRLMALISHDGTPASELRGFSAWLAVHLQEHAIELIDADPFGVMTYGDPASLSPDVRIHLLNALAKLAERDPWFRAGHWDAPVSGLGKQDLIPQFREILSKTDNSHSLRSVVIDAIHEGFLADKMVDILSELALNCSVDDSERASVIDAMLQVGDVGRKAVLTVYQKLSNSVDDLYIRSRVIRSMYGDGVGPEEVASLLSEVLSLEVELSIGVLWRLDEIVADCDIATTLELFESSGDDSVGISRRNTSEVIQVFDSLMCRVIRTNRSLNHEVVLNWLAKRSRIGHHLHQDRSDRLQASLADNRELLAAITERYLLAAESEEEPWEALYKLENLMVGAADMSIALKVSCDALYNRAEKSPFHFELALIIALRIGPPASLDFFQILSMNDADWTVEIAEKYTICPIQDWRVRDLKRRVAQKTKERTARDKRQREFDDCLSSILEGEHFEWLRFIGLTYFSLFSGLDAKVTPQQRLVSELGEARAEQALASIERFASAGPYPPVEKVLALNSESRYQEHWYAFIAGICQLHEKGYPLELLDEQRLCSALIIDELHPTFIAEGNVSRERVHHWKSELLERRPTLVAQIYERLVRHQLGARREHVTGLHELISYEQLAGVRSGIVVNLLRDFPVCEKSSLTHLIESTLSESPDELRKLIPLCRMAAKNVGNTPAWVIWTAFGLLLNLPDCLEDIQQSDGTISEMFIWAIRDAFGTHRKPAFLASEYIVEVVEEFVIQFIGARVRWTGHPKSGWCGDTNPWDAAEFVVARINKLATVPTDEATDALQRLIAVESLVSYRQFLLHAFSAQRVQKIDANFRRPTWVEVQKVLRGGAPANIADFQALAMAHFRDLGIRIAGANTDPYKQYWNVDGHGKVTTPKPEEVCRDALVEMLRPLFAPLGVLVEPEGHMASDKRADVCLFSDRMKLVIELKRDYHEKLWDAAERQLNRLYTRDPDTHGCGLYGVFWFGKRRVGKMPAPPSGLPRPDSASGLELALRNEIPERLRERIQVFVLDVSGEYL